MVENPPPSDRPSSVPPIQAYAEYPRSATPPRLSSPEKLQALMEGYYGLNWAFLAFFGLMILSFVALVATMASTTGIILFILLMVLAVVAVGVVSHPYNKKLGFGMDWGESTPLWISVGLAVGSIVISPVIVFVVLQLIAMGEIKNYGVQGGLLGVRKKAIKARIEQLKQLRTTDMSAPPSFQA